MGSWILRLLLFLICGISGYYLTTGISLAPQMGLWGFLGRTSSGGIGSPRGERIEKDPFKKPFRKFYRIDPWIHGCQSYLQRLSIQSIRPSTNHPSPLRWTLWDLRIYRPSDRLQKRGRNSSLRIGNSFLKAFLVVRIQRSWIPA